MQSDDRGPEDSTETEAGIGLELARSTLGELAIRAGYSGERIPLTRHGKPIAFIVGPKDVERLRALDAA